MKTMLLIILLSVAFNFAFGQGTVTFSGTAKHPEVTSVTIKAKSLFNTQQPEGLLTDYKQDNQFKGTFNLSKPQFLYLTIMLRNWVIYVTPGDTIRFTIDGAGNDAKIKFFGKHANNYHVFARIADFTIGPERAPRYLVGKEFRHNQDSLLKYKLKLDQWYKDKTKQMNELLPLCPISQELTHIARSKLSYYYVNSLYFVVSDMAIDSIPKDYLNEIKKNKFNDDRLLNTNEYRFALYNRYVRFKENEGEENLQRIERKIREELSGKTKD